MVRVGREANKALREFVGEVLVPEGSIERDRRVDQAITYGGKIQGSTGGSSGESSIVVLDEDAVYNALVSILEEGNGIVLERNAIYNTITVRVESTVATEGFILASPDGTRWRVLVTDAGVLTTTAI